MRIVVLAVFGLLGSLPLAAAPVLVDRIGAVVDGEPIACSEVLADAEALARQLGRPVDDELVARALDAKVVEALELAEAKRLRLSVSDEELARAVAGVEERNGLAPGTLRSVLEAQGISFARYREQLRRRLLVGKLINVAVRGRIKIPEEVLREAWRKRWAKGRTLHEARLRQIFVPLPPDPSPAAVEAVRARLERLRARALAGEDFARLARLYSQSPDREQGGDLGWIAEEAAPPLLRGVMALPDGAVSKPVRSPAGFHLFRVVAHRTRTIARPKAYEEVRLRQILLRVPRDATPAERARIRAEAERLARELARADDEAFARRAREVSQGPNADKGGDLGWLRTDQMLPELARAAARLAPGQTSGVVESRFGLHVLRLVARRHVDPASFEALRDQIEQALVAAAMQERLPAWIADLRARARIEMRGCRGVRWPFPRR